MSYDVSPHSSSGHDREGARRTAVPWELFVLGAALVLSPAVAAAVMAAGASPAAAALVMVMVIAAGVCASRFSTTRRSSTGAPSTEAPTAGGKAWPARSGHRGAGEPLTPVERQLSLRYGVAVEQVAGHVWLVGGELVEATLDRATGRLMTGSSELSLRRNRPR